MKSKEKNQLALEVALLRTRGWSLSEIADHFNISVRRVKKLLEKATYQLLGDGDDLQILRAIELERINRVIRTLTPMMEAGDSKAAKLVLEATRLRSELLGIQQQADIQTKTSAMWQKLASQLQLFKKEPAALQPAQTKALEAIEAVVEAEYEPVEPDVETVLEGGGLTFYGDEPALAP